MAEVMTAMRIPGRIGSLLTRIIPLTSTLLFASCGYRGGYVYDFRPEPFPLDQARMSYCGDVRLDLLDSKYIYVDSIDESMAIIIEGTYFKGMMAGIRFDTLPQVCQAGSCLYRSPKAALWKSGNYAYFSRTTPNTIWAARLKPFDPLKPGRNRCKPLTIDTSMLHLLRPGWGDENKQAEDRDSVRWIPDTSLHRLHFTPYLGHYKKP